MTDTYGQAFRDGWEAACAEFEIKPGNTRWTLERSYQKGWKDAMTHLNMEYGSWWSRNCERRAHE